MSLDAETGTEVHLGGFSLETLVGLRAGVDSLAKKLDNIKAVEDAYQFGVLEIPIRAVASAPSSGNFAIDLGGPTYGRFWEVKRLTVGGVLWSSVVNGTAIVVVGPSPNSSSAITPPLSDICDEAASLPSVAFYSSRQLLARHPNHIYVVILTPSASTQYAVGGQVSDFPDKRQIIETTN